MNDPCAINDDTYAANNPTINTDAAGLLPADHSS